MKNTIIRHCRRCGNDFEIEQDYATDICGTCFDDLRQEALAVRADAEAPAAAPGADGGDAQ